MPTKIQPTGLSRLALLVDAPLSCIATPYIEALQKQQYAKHTIELYLKCIIRFSCWLKTENLDLSSVTPKLIDHYLNDLMLLYPATVDARYFIRMDRAALRCLLILLPKQQVQITKKPIEAELDRFSDYLLNICGISPQTCVNRRQHICAFLKHRFDTAPPDISQISGDDIDAFFQHLALKWQPASLREVILTRALIFWATHLEPGDQRTVGESISSTLVRRSATKRRKRYGRKLEAGS